MQNLHLGELKIYAFAQASAITTTARPRGVQNASHGQSGADRTLILQYLRYLTDDTCYPPVIL